MTRTEGQRLWKVRRARSGRRVPNVRSVYADSRDAAALHHARMLFGIGQVAGVRHEERGWYTVTLTSGLERFRTMRVYAAKATARRGVDEALARTSLLHTLHAGTRSTAVRELALAEGGRADLVVIPSAGHLHAYEIKTEKDSLSRLPKQALEYAAHFARRTLATTPRHMQAARDLLPASWGLVELDPQSHAVAAEVRPCTPLSATFYTPAQTLLLELWKPELLELLRRTPTKYVARQNKTALRRLVLEHYGEDKARELAAGVLLQRDGRGRVAAVRLPLEADCAPF